MERVKSCNNCEHFCHEAAHWGQPYPEFWCDKEHWEGIYCKEDEDILSEEGKCADFEDNGYYTPDDLWSELSNSEKRERLSNSRYDLVIEPDGIWNSLSNNRKKKVLSSQGIGIPGMVDLNKIPLHELVQSLYEEIKFKSDSNSFVIGKLIDFYWANNPKIKPTLKIK